MRTITGAGFGRIVILGFDRGDKLLPCIREKCRELGIENAVVVSGVGTFEKAHFHRIKNCNSWPENEFITVDAPIELSSVDGMVVNGEPHFHMTFQDLEKTYAVHLEDESTVLYLAEVVLAELTGVSMERVPNEFGIKLLREKGIRTL